MLLDQASEAMSDFAKAVSLNGDFPIALVQKLYTDYRAAVAMSNAGEVVASLAAFEDAIRRFPTCPECFLLYAQVSWNPNYSFVVDSILFFFLFLIGFVIRCCLINKSL